MTSTSKLNVLAQDNLLDFDHQLKKKKENFVIASKIRWWQVLEQVRGQGGQNKAEL